MRHPKNIDYNLCAQKIKDVIFSHVDKDGISQFSTFDISPSAYFNREYAQAFLQWLKDNGIADTVFDTGNSNQFKIKVKTSFLESEINRKAFK